MTQLVPTPPTLSQEQQSALETLLVALSCLISREIPTSHPALAVEWELKVRGNEGERSWLGRMGSSEEIVRQPL